MFSLFTSFAFTLPESSITDMLASASGIFDDILPLALLLIAIPVGFWILEAILDATRPKKTIYTTQEFERRFKKSEKERTQEHVALTAEEEEFWFGPDDDYDD